MSKHPEEWFRQAEYDMDTAEFMFSGRRHFYSIFMCHLAIEKALKGLYSQKLTEAPPKTYNLLYLVEVVGVELPDELYDFVFTINRVSVPIRYPDDLRKMLEDYTEERTEEILRKSEEVLKWLKTQL